MKVHNIIHIIGYAFLYWINWQLYYVLHGHFNFMLLVLMTAFPVVSILFAIILVKNLSSEIHTGELNAREGSEGFFFVKILNKTYLTSLDVKVTLVVSNSYFGDEGRTVISIPVAGKHGGEITVPISSFNPGIVKLSIAKIEVSDLLGMFYLRVSKKKLSDAEISVLPNDGKSATISKEVMDQGMLESEESTKRGNDFSDVQEIREYIPGDKLMSIHWKLSAKRDILMVKDRVSMSDRQLVIVPELYSGDRVGLREVVEATYGTIKTLIQDKTTVRLIYWCPKVFEYEEIRIDYLSELDEAFTKMFYEEPCPVPEEAKSHMALVFPHIKAYLYVDSFGGEARVSVIENQ